MRPNRLRILLVDRDRDRRQRLCARLYAELRCSTVVTAVGGGDDLRALREATFDVCVLSLSEGFSALDEAQALRLEYPDVPIVAVDGDLGPSELELLLDCGVQEHVARRCVVCPANQRLCSSIEWAVERNRLLRHLEEVLDESERCSLHDSLTGLPNRKLFVDRLDHLIQRCTRNEGSFAVLFIDLDRFKRVNDSLGHEGGDQLLVEMARRLAACVRVSDSSARWGGDEFLVTLEGVRTREDATAVARKIARRLVEPTLIGGREVQVCVSIGVSICPLDSHHGPTLIHQADLAMYRAKAAGGGQVQCFRGEMDVEVQRGHHLESQLRTALDRGQLSLAFQPQVDLPSLRVVGFEALMRWTHPRMGPVPPSRFIPAAEESGLIIPMGEWAIRETCERIASWHEAGLHSVPVAVNVSGRQLQQPGFEEMVAGTLRETGVPGSELEIELTETTVVDDPARVEEALRRLRRLGVRAALDDFGTGHSSLAVLGSFPFARLKIDRSFVQGIPSDPKAVAITTAIVHMARSLGMRTVAEGVEREDQLAGLREPGCEGAQGFLFSPAVPAERATGFLAPAGQESPGPSAPWRGGRLQAYGD